MDPADTRHQVAVWFFFVGGADRRMGVDLTKKTRAGWKHAYQRSTSTAKPPTPRLQTGRSQRVMEGIGLLEAFQVFVGWL